MGRWRPPPPVSSKYITPEGKQRLEEELEYLWRKKRPEVTRALSEAAAETYDNLSLSLTHPGYVFLAVDSLHKRKSHGT